MPIKAERHLTDADVEAIVREAKKSIVDEFYSDLGRGIWAIVWKAVIVAIVGIAAYGSMKGMK